MSIPLNIQCYGRGDSGVPSTAYPLPDLKDRIDSYQHTISDHYGFESCTLSMVASLTEASEWLRNGLMRSLIVYGPAGEICWEGFLETITVTIGQKKASLSLANMANNMRYLWTTLQGTPGDTPIPATTASLLSQSIYGRKDYVGSLPKVTAANVISAGAKTLNTLCFPRSSDATDAVTGGLGEIVLELSFAGWYTVLEWAIVSNSSTLNTITNTQLSSTYLPSYAAINAFLSTDTSGVTFTGPLSTEYVAHFSTYRQVIDRLCGMGDSANSPLAWGVYEDRRFQAATSAAATPDTITYVEDAGAGIIVDAFGNQVKPWNVRPNAMSQVTQLLDSAPVSGTIDAAARKYVARITCGIQGDSIGCTLEPGGAGGLDALVAAFPPTFFYNG